MPDHSTIPGFSQTARVVRAAALRRGHKKPQLYWLGDRFGWDRLDSHNLTDPEALAIYLIASSVGLPEGYHRVARIMCQSIATYKEDTDGGQRSW